MIQVPGAHYRWLVLVVECTYPYYHNYMHPSYAGSYYYSRPTPYNDPYVALRPYSDGAGPKAN